MPSDSADLAIPMTRVPVDLAGRSYDVLIGKGLIDKAGELMAGAVGGRRFLILTDEQVAPLWLEKLQDSLMAEGHSPAADPLILPAGEATKSLEQFGQVLDHWLAAGIDRRAVVVLLGGGVIGDLGGYAAASALRGLSFIQVPTTLLAQVDSSVGGKTGINCRHGKNLIGAFHQPRLVLADTDTLATLPPREMLAGYAEVVKYAMLGDAGFMTWLEQHGPALLDGDAGLQAEAVARSVAMKAEIVAEDEKEAGRRALLNLGHTFGHALEARGGYDGRLLHGEAVGIGMLMAAGLSARLGMTDDTAEARLRAHLTTVGLPVCPSERQISISADEMIALMGKDKKVADGQIVFILLEELGEAVIRNDVAIDAVGDFLSDILPAG
ncbi:MAG: 3-dehydroquinate synthase [Alphaproteobacteria bacterium]